MLMIPSLCGCLEQSLLLSLLFIIFRVDEISWRTKNGKIIYEWGPEMKMRKYNLQDKCHQQFSYIIYMYTHLYIHIYIYYVWVKSQHNRKLLNLTQQYIKLNYLLFEERGGLFKTI